MATTTTAPHLIEPRHYASLREALADAERVLSDLVGLVDDGELLVPAERVEFLARRARVLVMGCSAAVPEELA